MGAGSTFSQGANANVANPYAGTSSPYYSAAQAQSVANLAGAQQATQANRVNQNTPYSSLNYTQSVDANGNPTWTANQQLTQPLQSALGNISQNVANTTQNPFNTTPYQAQTSQGLTGMEGWDKATQLINQRLQPQMAQAAESNTAALANQGIVPGTQAYNNAMRTFQQGQNDLMNQAQLAGSQVQNTMQGQTLAQQQANNSALQQNYAQNYAAYNNPLQQLGAFQQGTQPGYINAPQQAAVTGPDYMGALQTQTNANIASQNAALGQATNQTAGLYGLGAAGILGLAANPGAISGIGTGISNAYNYLTTPSTTDYSNILNIPTANWATGNF